MTHAEIIALLGDFIGPAILPTTAIVISIFRSDSRIESLGNRLDAKIDAKVDALGNRLDAKVDLLANRLDAKLDAKVDGLRNDIRGDMSILDGITYDHHGRITRMETKADPGK